MKKNFGILLLVCGEIMIGIGTVLNTAGIIAGGLTGKLAGRFFNQKHQEALGKANGVSVLFIGMAGALQGMLSIDGTKLASGRSMLVVLCLALGTLIGEMIGIESGFEKFGGWLKGKTGNAKDAKFVDAFVTASLTVSIGAMAIVGALKDGMTGDWSVLAVKTVLDFIIIAVLTSSLGTGCVFSAIPVLVFEGLVTLLARLIQPIMTELAVANVSLIGSIMIFCVGVNLVWEKKIRVANMLPAIILAICAAYVPWEL